MKCAICEKTFDPSRTTAYEIRAWIVPGKKGPHWPEQTGRQMCPTCVVNKTYGVSTDQMTLA